jgi:hypothetical protein
MEVNVISCNDKKKIIIQLMQFGTHVPSDQQQGDALLTRLWRKSPFDALNRQMVRVAKSRERMNSMFEPNHSRRSVPVPHHEGRGHHNFPPRQTSPL